MFKEAEWQRFEAEQAAGGCNEGAKMRFVFLFVLGKKWERKRVQRVFRWKVSMTVQW